MDRTAGELRTCYFAKRALAKHAGAPRAVAAGSHTAYARGAPAKLHQHVRRARRALLSTRALRRAEAAGLHAAYARGAPAKLHQHVCRARRALLRTRALHRAVAAGSHAAYARNGPKQTASRRNRASIMMSAAPGQVCRALLSARPHRIAVAAAAAGSHVPWQNRTSMNRIIEITVSVD